MSAPRTDADDSEHQLHKAEKLYLKKKGIGSEARAERIANADADLQLLGQAEQGRHIQKLKKRQLQGREEDTLAKLEKFKSSLFSMDPALSSSESKASDEEDYSGWRTHKLTFASDASQKDAMARKEDPNDYVVFDPLLEKGKEKFNKMQAKLKRRDREWAGRSLT